MLLCGGLRCTASKIRGLHLHLRVICLANHAGEPKETAASLAWGGHANRRRRIDT